MYQQIKYIFTFILLLSVLLQNGYAVDSTSVSDSLKQENSFFYNQLSSDIIAASLINLQSGETLSFPQKEKLSFIQPQQLPVHKINPLKTNVNYTILAGMGAGYIAAGTYLHLYQKNAWWNDNRVKFHFQNDWEYALWIDKIGHFYGTNILAHAISGAFEAANVQSEESAIFSALSAFAFEMLIEYEDGFGENWGFSPGDALFDALGAGFYISQYYYPFLKNFQPRWSYLPTKDFKDNPNKIIIDDYEGQKYWISMRVKNFLPDKIARFWPSFLNISAGMGVKNLDGAGGGQQEFYLALDLDAEELIPFNGPVWQFIKNSLNYFHFPMPGVRITPDAAFFIICF